MTEYPNTRDSAEVERLVNENHSLVEWCVNRFLRRAPLLGAEREDLVSWGLLGLLQAARAFDPGRGYRFSTFAVVSIERQILRGAERAGRGQDALLSLDAPTRGASEPEANRWELIPDERAELALLCSETELLLEDALATLAPEQQQLIYAHFYQGHSLAALARAQGLPRYVPVHQLRSALVVLRRRLEGTQAAGG